IGAVRPVGADRMRHVDLALHVLEVMEAFHTAASTGRTVAITPATERPAPLSYSTIDGRLAK
ncbi:gfo/Idh/MocA family oxidoreductase, partial [Rhizobium leguminosarum]